MPQRLARAIAVLTVVLAFPATAAATDYCVPTTAACPGAAGTAQATFEAALAQASAAANADKIYLASGTFTAPTTSGFSYNLAAGPIDVVGSGARGLSLTNLTTPTGSSGVLKLVAANGSTISHLAVSVADNAAVSSRGLDLVGVAATDVVLNSGPTEPNPFFGVVLGASASLASSSVDVPFTPGNMTAVWLNGPNTSIADATLSGRTGISSNSSVVTATLDRLKITSSSTGVSATGSTLSIHDSLLVLASGCALGVIDQPSTDGLINADGATIVGTNTAANALCASSINAAPRTATINLTNSIIRGVGLGRTRFSSSNGIANVNVTYSDFDPATDGADTAPGAYSPAAGQLGATNINADPLFTSASDYRLLAGSPVVDKGDPTLTSTTFLDLGGFPLLFDGDADCVARRDMGAYERQSGTAPVCPFPVAMTPGSTPPAPGATTPPITLPVGTPPVLDRIKPKLTKLRLRNARLRFTLSEAATVRIDLYRGTKRVRRVTIKGRPGANVLKLTLPARRARLSLRLRATDKAGNAGAAKLAVPASP